MIQLRAFGTASLKGPEGNELHSVLSRPKLLGLLTFLAASLPAGLRRRETLLGLFWGEVEQERARASLRQSLYNLRQSLGGGVIEGRGDEEVGLAPRGLWCDVRAFRDALNEGRREEALDLYRGDLLLGFVVPNAPEFERWLEDSRATLRRQASDAAWLLADEQAGAGNAAAAGHWVRRALTLEPYDEELLRRAVRLLDRIGDRAGAVQAFENFARRLEEELDLKPSPDSEELIRRIRESPGGEVPARATATASAPTAEKSKPDNGTGEGSPSPAPGPLLDRLRRRHVVQWGVAYVGGAWLVLQVVDVLGEQFAWPMGLQRGFTLILGIGLFVTLVLAWYHGEKGRQRVSGPELLILGMLLLLGAGSVAILRRPPDSQIDRAKAPVEDVSQPPSAVAVLPFDDFSAEGLEYFASGVHEDILTHLSGISGLTVVSRRSVERYADSDLTLPEIARELGVGSVLEGSVRLEGDRVRVTAQLIDALTDKHLWAEMYDRSLDNIFEVQSDIARRVAGSLRATLSTEEEQRITRRPTASLRAYELFLQARKAHASAVTAEELLEEERLLKAALELDPGFARAWAALAENFASRRWDYGLGQIWADSAGEAARRAVELDPGLAQGYQAVGTVYAEQLFLREALENYARAVELDPNLASAHWWLGRTLAQLGRHDEALDSYRRALRRNPHLRGIRTQMGHSYATIGDLPTAEFWFREEMEQASDEPKFVYQTETSMHWWAGRLGAAVGASVRVVDVDPGDVVARVGLAERALDARDYGLAIREIGAATAMAQDVESLAYYYFATTTLGVALQRGGDSVRARAPLERSREALLAQVRGGNQWPVTSLELAAVYDALGQRGEAIQWARRAFEAGARQVHSIEVSPLFDGLRDDPLFQEVVRGMRADIELMRERVFQRERDTGLR